jgi:parallel beta-helix repeat protein
LKELFSGFLLILLCASMFALASNIQLVKAAGTIYILPDGTVSPPTAPILRNGSTYTLTGNIDGDIVVVEADNIVIDGAGHTVKGAGPSSMQNEVDLSGRTNVTFSNAQVTYSTYGLMLSASSHNNISGNSITGMFAAAIYLDSSSSDNLINGNDITSNTYDGIYDHSTGHNSVIGNNITSNGMEGIGLYSCSGDNINGNNITNTNFRLRSSSNNNITGNNVKYNNLDIDSNSYNNSINGNTFINTGILAGGSHQNSVENNTVNGKPLVYLEDVADYNVGLAGQIILVNCDNMIIENHTISNVFSPIQLINTNNSIISRNTLTSNGGLVVFTHSSNESIIENKLSGYSLELSSNSNNNSINGNTISTSHPGDSGIDISSSFGNIIRGNNIIGNANIGINDDSVGNSIIENNITNNSCGIALYYSGNVIRGNNITNNNVGIWLVTSYASNNGIYHNNIMNNAYQISGSGGLNVWDDDYPYGGNYWSDYSGADNFSGPYQNITGSDGIGDTAYVIGTNNTDRYPFMKIWYSILGDINGDGKVSLSDLVLLANAYGSKQGDAKWDPNADINGDGKISLTDLVLLANHYGQHRQ